MSGSGFSFARHALITLGTATAGIAAIVIVLMVVQPGPVGSLIVVGVGLVATVLLLSWAARRNLDRHVGGAGREDSGSGGS